jgi:hypothetical protein
LFAEVNLALLVAYAELGGVSANWPEVAEMARQHRAFAFVAPRGRKGRVFVLAGRDAGAATEIVHLLAGAASMPERGLVVSLPATASPPPPGR